MKKVILLLSIIIASGSLFINVYNSIVDAVSWGSNIPSSIAVTRDYFKVVNPGTFLRVISPVNQILALIVFILFWKSPRNLRVYLGISFILYVLVDVLTFGYFYPRLSILFTAPLNETKLITKAWSEWCSMNWIRSLILLVGIVLSSLTLDKTYKLQAK